MDPSIDKKVCSCVQLFSKKETMNGTLKLHSQIILIRPYRELRDESNLVWLRHHNTSYRILWKIRIDRTEMGNNVIRNMTRLIGVNVFQDHSRVRRPACENVVVNK